MGVHVILPLYSQRGLHLAHEKSFVDLCPPRVSISHRPLYMVLTHMLQIVGTVRAPTLRLPTPFNATAKTQDVIT